ncbi:hypothetical protein D3C81_1966310 [compost metagenome]
MQLGWRAVYHGLQQRCNAWVGGKMIIVDHQVQRRIYARNCIDDDRSKGQWAIACITLDQQQQVVLKWQPGLS